ncbi:hypothetical protein Peur_073905 [Populus x canadensis]
MRRLCTLIGMASRRCKNMGRESMMPMRILSPLFCSQGPVAVCVCGRCCKHNKEHSTQCNQAAYISYRLGLDKLYSVENPLVGHLICEMHLVVNPSQDTVAASFAAPFTCSKVVNMVAEPPGG